jgi:hypothetical protein
MDDSQSFLSLIAGRAAATGLDQYDEQDLRTLAELVEQHLQPDADTIVEFGTGVSTLVLGEALARCRSATSVPPVLLSIDHAGDWQREVASRLPWWPFLHLRTHARSTSPGERDKGDFDYATAPYLLRRRIDLIYVDGRDPGHCILAVAPLLRDDASIIVNDGQGERYRFLDGYFNTVKSFGRFKVYGAAKVSQPLQEKSANTQRLGIIRVIMGRHAQAEAAVTRHSVERYARAIGAEFVEHFVDEAALPTALLKFLLSAELERFDRAIYVDCDLVVRAGAPSLFDIVPESDLGVVCENRFLDRSASLDLMVAVYDVKREHGPGTAPYFNSGVMVLSRCHYPLLRLPETGTLYEDPMFEQTYLNARVRALDIPLYDLPKEFNYIPQYDGHVAADWRYGWLIHLAGWWEGELKTPAYWRETGRRGDFIVRSQQPIAARETRVPRLRTLARAIDNGERAIVLCAPHFILDDPRRMVFDHTCCCLVINLRAPAAIIMWGPYIALDAGIWIAAVQLRGAGAAGATLTIDCAEKLGTAALRARTPATADDNGVIRFQIDLDHRAEHLEVRIWEGSAEPVFFESLELTRVAD